MKTVLIPMLILVMAIAVLCHARSEDAIKYDQIQSLLFRRGQLTTGRRSPGVHQLTCRGPWCQQYQQLVDSVHCQNTGTDDYGNVVWTCDYEVPATLKLTDFDVSCEGYDSPQDPYVLRGSCGLTYLMERVVVPPLAEPEPSVACKLGYKREGGECRDVDECELYIHNCDPHATCINTPGSFTCRCNSGWISVGLPCYDITNCEKGGWITGTNRGTICQDINECREGTHNCPDHSRCINTEGSFLCACEEGWIPGTEGRCVDFNECMLHTHNCDTNARCRNTKGSYTCQCNEGYSGDGRTCSQNIAVPKRWDDACEKHGSSCSREATCVNDPSAIGGYTCVCKDGYSDLSLGLGRWCVLHLGPALAGILVLAGLLYCCCDGCGCCCCYSQRKQRPRSHPRPSSHRTKKESPPPSPPPPSTPRRPRRDTVYSAPPPPPPPPAPVVVLPAPSAPPVVIRPIFYPPASHATSGSSVSVPVTSAGSSIRNSSRSDSSVSASAPPSSSRSLAEEAAEVAKAKVRRRAFASSSTR